MAYLVTGAAGFIGMHTCLKLLSQGKTVIGIDNLNDYYDVQLKLARLKKLRDYSNFHFDLIDIKDKDSLANIFKKNHPKFVVHLAAQAGVRYSLENPLTYIESNVHGFVNILECCREHSVSHFVYASSSSVYGGNTKPPFSKADAVDHPVSLYAATKKSNELIAHTYSHLFGIATTGLRFFTVYGPWGRPDMSPMIFAKAIMSGQPINVFNNGQMSRDFTYIDDIVEGILRVLQKPATKDNTFNSNKPNPSTGNAPYRIFNIGNNTPVSLMDYIKKIETAIGIPATINFMPLQPGDVISTMADTKKLEDWVDYKPQTNLDSGIDKFVQWFLEYNQ